MSKIKSNKNNLVALSAVMADIGDSAPDEIKLLPCGAFRSTRDNRPTGLSAWTIDRSAAKAIIANQAALACKFLIDYDHQTLNAAGNGKPAPAAGWAAHLEWRDNDGLYATNIEWTEAALSAIAAKEFRYISPVITWDKNTGMITSVPMAALTNYPALDNLNDLAANAGELPDTELDSEDLTMALNQLLDKLRPVLGLANTATFDEAIAELDKLAPLTAGASTGLSGKLLADQAQITALSAQSASIDVDPAKFVPMAVYLESQTKLSALSGNTVDMQVEKAIEEAVRSGKINGELQKAHFTGVGKDNLATLQGLLASMPEIKALTGLQSDGKKAALDQAQDALSGAATEQEKEVAKMLGLTTEQIIAQRGKI